MNAKGVKLPVSGKEIVKRIPDKTLSNQRFSLF